MSIIGRLLDLFRTKAPHSGSDPAGSSSCEGSDSLSDLDSRIPSSGDRHDACQHAVDTERGMFRLETARWFEEALADRRKEQEEQRYEHDCYSDPSVDELKQ